MRIVKVALDERQYAELCEFRRAFEAAYPEHPGCSDAEIVRQAIHRCARKGIQTERERQQERMMWVKAALQERHRADRLQRELEELEALYDAERVTLLSRTNEDLPN
jgi:hypothetical protein